MLSNLLPLLIVKDPKMVLVWYAFERIVKAAIAGGVILKGKFK